mmetsp:Transcript_60284/g.191503  ORF Transcript_60284/g.191503 Transcript_60284/m.191503 type:complete len:216 (-) Transcript_60284:794-1441(-)
MTASSSSRSHISTGIPSTTLLSPHLGLRTLYAPWQARSRSRVRVLWSPLYSASISSTKSRLVRNPFLVNKAPAGRRGTRHSDNSSFTACRRSRLAASPGPLALGGGGAGASRDFNHSTSGLSLGTSRTALSSPYLFQAIRSSTSSASCLIRISFEFWSLSMGLSPGAQHPVKRPSTTDWLHSAELLSMKPSSRHMRVYWLKLSPELLCLLSPELA